MVHTKPIMHKSQQSAYFKLYEKFNNEYSIKYQTEDQLVTMIRNLNVSNNAFVKTLKLYELCFIDLHEHNEYKKFIKKLLEILIDEFLYSVQNAQDRIRQAFSKQNIYYKEFYPSNLEGFAHASHADLGLAMLRMAKLTQKYEQATGEEVKMLFNNYYKHFSYLTKKGEVITPNLFTSPILISFVLKRILQLRIRKNEVLIHKANIR